MYDVSEIFFVAKIFCIELFCTRHMYLILYRFLYVPILYLKSSLVQF